MYFGIIRTTRYVKFRSWQIWKHPALADYKYMLWMDSDGFSTRVWEQDPIAYTVAHDLVVLADNFPQGTLRGWVKAEVDKRSRQVFNKTLCALTIQEDGTYKSQVETSCGGGGRAIGLIHGFFHITNLDFFRTDLMAKWQETFIGDCYLCREFDDQVQLTVSAGIMAPERTKDMRLSGLNLGVYHNLYIDGKGDRKIVFKRYWKLIQNYFTEAKGVCPIKANG